VRRGAPDALRLKRKPDGRWSRCPAAPRVSPRRSSQPPTRPPRTKAHKRAHPAKCDSSVRTNESGDDPIPTNSATGSPDLQRPFDLRIRSGRRDGGLALPGLVALETLQRSSYGGPGLPARRCSSSKSCSSPIATPPQSKNARGANILISRLLSCRVTPGRGSPRERGTRRLLPLRETASIPVILRSSIEHFSRRGLDLTRKYKFLALLIRRKWRGTGRRGKFLS
jgi:hypothetical protein